ncbi:MAG: hypothetical protein ABSB12_01840 [Candidatus Saccharimonadales bacterium]|jgi:hypothetical protein
MARPIKDERGISRKFLVGGIVIVLIVIGVVVWLLTKSSSNNTNSTSTNTSTTVNNSVLTACINAYHDSELCSYAGNLNIFGTAWTSTGTASNSNGSANFVMENDGKGDNQISYTTASRQVSEITLGNNEYVQIGAGTTWIEYPVGSASIPSAVLSNPQSDFNLSIAGKTASDYTFTKIGNAACGNQSCVEYKLLVTAKPNLTQYVYFNPATRKLMKWVYSNSATNGSINITFTYEPVNITVPSPVQQATT